jgi:hypothetical protein
MTNDTPLKSAYDLAMERLLAKDRAQGLPERKPLTGAQKKEISRLREEARAKLAELEIMYRKDLEKAAGDPEKIKELEEHYDIDRRRVESALEAAVDKIKNRD